MKYTGHRRQHIYMKTLHWRKTDVSRTNSGHTEPFHLQRKSPVESLWYWNNPIQPLQYYLNTLWKQAYISRAYPLVSMLIPLGAKDCSLHIQRSSKNLRACDSFFLTCWMIKTPRSFSISWSLWKCPANSELEGRFFISYLCLANLVANVLLVCPT